jgi:hypothetical protein
MAQGNPPKTVKKVREKRGLLRKSNIDGMNF